MTKMGKGFYETFIDENKIIIPLKKTWEENKNIRN